MSSPPAACPDAPAADAGAGPVLPRYGQASLADLLPAVLAGLGVAGQPDTLGLPPCRQVAVVLLDGLGLELLRRHGEHAPFLSCLLADGRGLTAGFPTTTATSLTTLGTGRAPGVHGVLGYQVRNPAGGVLKALRWDDDVDPRSWQPHPTVFEQASAAGVTVTQVAPRRFHGSGLTVAALRGAVDVAAETPGERAAATVDALRATAGAPTLVYTYYGDLDATGHRAGCSSEAWRMQLAHTDRLCEQIAERLPDGATMLVTADHGMVDVDPAWCFDADAEPALTEGVEVLTGEARARYVHARPGAAADVLGAWRERLGAFAWVLSRGEAIAAGWFGPEVPEAVRPRIGDVVAAARGRAAVVATTREPAESSLIGMHGSLTAAEQLVPLLSVTA